MKKITAPLFLLTMAITSMAQGLWWGASVGLGYNQPYVNQSEFNLHVQDENNQLVPLFLSNDGRYRWSDSAFIFSVEDGKLITSIPMTTPGTERTVTLPKGTWRDEQGKRYRGGKTYTISVPLARLPYFELVK